MAMQFNSLADLYRSPAGRPNAQDFMRTESVGVLGAKYQTLDPRYYGAVRDWNEQRREAGLGYIEGLMQENDARMEGLFSGTGESYDDMMGQFREQMSLNDDLRAQYEELYMPLREEFVSAGRRGITADYTGAMSQAEAQVQGQFENARGEMGREAARYGINPSDGRYISSERAMRLAEAAARASSRTGAYRDERKRVEDTNFARMGAALSTAPGPGAFSNDSALNAMAGLTNAKAANNMAQAQYLAQGQAGLGQLLSQFNATTGGEPQRQRINGTLI